MDTSRIRSSVHVLICALLLPWNSNAGFWDGYKLKELADADDRMVTGMQQPNDSEKSANFFGFVVGVHDTVEGVQVCAPDGTRISQLGAIVKKHLRENPAKWNRPASTLVVEALLSVFPCKK